MKRRGTRQRAQRTRLEEKCRGGLLRSRRERRRRTRLLHRSLLLGGGGSWARGRQRGRPRGRPRRRPRRAAACCATICRRVVDERLSRRPQPTPRLRPLLRTSSTGTGRSGVGDGAVSGGDGEALLLAQQGALRAGRARGGRGEGEGRARGVGREVQAAAGCRDLWLQAAGIYGCRLDVAGCRIRLQDVAGCRLKVAGCRWSPP